MKPVSLNLTVAPIVTYVLVNMLLILMLPADTIVTTAAPELQLVTQLIDKVEGI